MNFFIDLLNTVIQVSIMTYLPYYFLITNKDIHDKDGKKSLVISSISIFVTSVLATHIFKNSNIMTYLPYYFLITNKDIHDKDGKKSLVISSISIFVTSVLATHIFKNSNMTSTSITIMSLIIMCITYMNVYKKALVAYSIAYLLVQIVAILVTSIFWPIISNIIYDVELSRLLGIYIPAMILELLVIKSKDSVKVIYDKLTKSKASLGIVFILFILVMSMDFIASISMILNGWANVALTNVLILMIVIFIIGISVYMNSMDKKYEEINRLNNLLIAKNNELKKIKHDYGSQISYINGLYIMQQYDRLGEMLKNIINGNKWKH